MNLRSLGTGGNKRDAGRVKNGEAGTQEGREKIIRRKMEGCGKVEKSTMEEVRGAMEFFLTASGRSKERADGG